MRFYKIHNQLQKTPLPQLISGFNGMEKTLKEMLFLPYLMGNESFYFIINQMNTVKRTLEKSEGKHSSTSTQNSTQNQSCQERQENDLFQVKRKKGKAKKDQVKFKTEMCKNFSEKGYCPYAKKCRFAHGSREMVQVGVTQCFRTKRCHGFWSQGFCQYGVRCQFAHEHQEWQVKPFLLGVTSSLQTTSGIFQKTPGKLMSLLHPTQ